MNRPHRGKLREYVAAHGDRPVVLARELTKTTRNILRQYFELNAF